MSKENKVFYYKIDVSELNKNEETKKLMDQLEFNEVPKSNEEQLAKDLKRNMLSGDNGEIFQGSKYISDSDKLNMSELNKDLSTFGLSEKQVENFKKVKQGDTAPASAIVTICNNADISNISTCMYNLNEGKIKNYANFTGAFNYKAVEMSVERDLNTMGMVVNIKSSVDLKAQKSDHAEVLTNLSEKEIESFDKFLDTRIQKVIEVGNKNHAFLGMVNPEEKLAKAGYECVNKFGEYLKEQVEKSNSAVNLFLSDRLNKDKISQKDVDNYIKIVKGKELEKVICETLEQGVKENLNSKELTDKIAKKIKDSSKEIGIEMNMSDDQIKRGARKMAIQTLEAAEKSENVSFVDKFKTIARNFVNWITRDSQKSKIDNPSST